METLETKLGRYRRLCEHAIGAQCAVAIVTESDSSFTAQGKFDSQDVDIVIRNGIADGRRAVNTFYEEEDFSIAMRYVEFDRKGKHLVVIKAHKPGDREHLLAELVKEISDAIADYFESQQILDGLSDELSERYEELNLLYHFDEDIQKAGNLVTTEERIERILLKCREYLPIDMVGVIVPGDGYHLYTSNESINSTAADRIFHQLKNSVSLKSRSQFELAVNNHDEAVDLSTTLIQIPYKTIMAPLVIGSNEIVGALLFANRLHQDDFSNSDRKIAEVTAADISKILRENRDYLTNLYNRTAFEIRMARVIGNAKADGTAHVLLYMDLDHFKLINDSIGHAAGDKLLIQGSAIFRKEALPGWYIARLGDNEFGILIENKTLEAGRRIADLIRKRVGEHRFVFDSRTFQTTVSISVVPINRHTRNPTELFAAADVACQLAKDTGRDTVRCYNPSDPGQAHFHNQIKQASTIADALENDQFILYGQEITPLFASGGGKHFEVLVRMRDHSGGIVSPSVFIPAAEKYGLITALDRWVVDNSLRVMTQLDSNNSRNGISCSINLSGSSVGDPEFLGYIARALRNTQISASRITFEVTETVAISNLAVALDFINSIKALGCLFALDDFGVGTSSFGSLRTLPVDYVKIDGSFVKSIVTNKLDLAVVRSINDIVHLMGLKTVAEFVENRPIFDLLKETGIDYVQGFEIDRPSLLLEKIIV